MSSGNFDLTTYYAKRIIGDAAAATATNALLQTGDDITSNTWILHRTNRTTKKYGIHYAYDGTNGHDKIEFYGKETNDNATAWIQLDTGDASFNSILGKVEITNIDIPNTVTSYYFPYVSSSSSGVQALLTSGRIYLYEGTNRTHICIGNSTRQGGITLWGSGGNYTDIITEAATSNKTVHIPNYSGWVAVGGDGSSTGVGNSYIPVYLSASGQLTTTTSYFVNGSTNSHQLGGFSVIAASTTHTDVANYAGHRLTLMTTDDGLFLWDHQGGDNEQGANVWSWRKNSSGIWQGSITGNAVTATRANITTTQYGIAYYSNATGTFASTTYGTAGQVLIGKGNNSAPDWYGGLTLTGTQASDWQVTINGTSASVSTYSSNALYVQGGGGFAKDILINEGYIRTGAGANGKTGWYCMTYVGGIFMQDTYYIRMHSDKQFLISSNHISSDAVCSSQLIVSSLSYSSAATQVGETANATFGSSTGGGTVAIELWRGSNASWQISNNAGTLYFKNNWTTALQSTYTQTAMSIACNTGNTTISGELTVNNLIKSTYNDNTVTIGSQNNGYCHIYNSANIPFIFNKAVHAIGKADLGNASYPWGNLYIGGANNGIYFVGTKNNYRMIRFLDNTSDIYGNGISIGGGGVTILGSGESSDTLITNLSLTGGTETTYIASDDSIEFYPSQQSYDASAHFTMTDGRFWAGVNGNTTRETSVGAQSGAGQIYMWSHAATSGSRGIYVPAHGTGAAKTVLGVDTNNNVTFYGGQFIGNGKSSTWIKGRDNAVFKVSTINEYSPAISIKTTNGSWEIGAYNYSGYYDDLFFSYCTDTNYNANSNSAVQLKFTEEGHFHSRTIHVHPSTSSYTEGVRIYPYSGWSTIMLGGNDLTAETGTSANSWGIFNNNGTLYINNNASSTAKAARAFATANGWTFGNTSANSYALNSTDLCLTGGIYYAGTKQTYRMIRFIDNTAGADGNGISIGGGGLTILGSGESADTLFSNVGATGGTETTYISSDGNIEFLATQQNGYDASARIWMTASVLNIGVDGNTTRESSINIYSGAGRIQLYSAASATGNRGLWVAAHGTGSAKNVILVDTNNNVTLNGNAATATKLTDIGTGDAASSSTTWRNVWISYTDNKTGRPAYDTNFAYQTSTGSLKLKTTVHYLTTADTYFNSFYQNSAFCGGMRLTTLGPANTEGWVDLLIGNNKASSAANNASGRIYLANKNGTWQSLAASYGTLTGATRHYILASHWLSATGIANAVWNDYAECRNVETDERGYCVTETTNGQMIKTTERLQAGCKITSDTFGSCMGETKDAKTPIAVSGRVLVYPYRAREEYPLGAAVCSAPGGTVDIMTRDEIMMYPERIVGTVSEIPTYEIWQGGLQDGENDIQVNGRIWIYVR